MRSLYLVNMWDEMLSERGFRLFEGAGYDISGNWFSPPRGRPIMEAKPDVAIVGPARDDSEVLGYLKKTRIPYVVWVIFPDLNIGWDSARRSYGFNAQGNFLDAVEPVAGSSGVFVNSRYTQGLIEKACGLRCDVCYPGIDTEGILARKSDPGPGLSVLWNHKWRSDKGVDTALGIVDRLSADYPGVDFILGSKERWDLDDKLLPAMQGVYRGFLGRTRRRENVVFQGTVADPWGYWSLLGRVDISFSVSLHESFGLGSLESSLVHATILPDREVYPEIFGAGLSADVEGDLRRAIEDKGYREGIARSRNASASRFDISSTVRQWVSILERI